LNVFAFIGHGIINE
jgi:hypothetical protein